MYDYIFYSLCILFSYRFGSNFMTSINDDGACGCLRNARSLPISLEY